MTSRSFGKPFWRRMKAEVERQGGHVKWCRRGLKVYGPNGGSHIIHTTPTRPELYRRTVDIALRAIGIETPKGGW